MARKPTDIPYADCADAALHDLRRASLPQEVEAVVIAVADAILPPLQPLISDTVKLGFPALIPEAPWGARAQAFFSLANNPPGMKLTLACKLVDGFSHQG